MLLPHNDDVAKPPALNIFPDGLAELAVDKRLIQNKKILSDLLEKDSKYNANEEQSTDSDEEEETASDSSQSQGSESSDQEAESEIDTENSNSESTPFVQEKDLKALACLHCGHEMSQVLLV